MQPSYSSSSPRRLSKISIKGRTTTTNDPSPYSSSANAGKMVVGMPDQQADKALYSQSKATLLNVMDDFDTWFGGIHDAEEKTGMKKRQQQQQARSATTNKAEETISPEKRSSSLPRKEKLLSSNQSKEVISKSVDKSKSPQSKRRSSSSARASPRSNRKSSKYQPDKQPPSISPSKSTEARTPAGGEPQVEQNRHQSLQEDSAPAAEREEALAPPALPTSSSLNDNLRQLTGRGVVKSSRPRSRSRGPSGRQSSRAAATEFLQKHDVARARSNSFARTSTTRNHRNHRRSSSDHQSERWSQDQGFNSPRSSQNQGVPTHGFITPPSMNSSPPSNNITLDHEELLFSVFVDEKTSRNHDQESNNENERMVPLKLGDDTRRSERRGPRSSSLSRSEPGRQPRSRGARKDGLSMSEHGGRSRGSSRSRHGSSSGKSSDRMLSSRSADDLEGKNEHRSSSTRRTTSPQSSKDTKKTASTPSGHHRTRSMSSPRSSGRIRRTHSSKNGLRSKPSMRAPSSRGSLKRTKSNDIDGRLAGLNWQSKNFDSSHDEDPTSLLGRNRNAEWST